MDPPPPPPLNAADDTRRRCRKYLLALEEERSKIQVFKRELPLCLDLVTQTIERLRSEVDGVGSEETVSDHGPVLEEFMPLKPSLSLSSSEEHDSARDADGKKEEKADTPPAEVKKTTPDWLQSVQLWSQEPLRRSTSPPHKETMTMPCKPVALNARKTGGAFQPFEKEKRVELPASSTTAAASSAVIGDSGGDKAASVDTEKRKDDKEVTNKDAAKGKEKEAQSQPSSNRKQRRSWSPDLHRRFLQALDQLGGPHVATPKQIRELMKVDGLTNDEVKSHLQKFRLHTRRPTNSTVQSSSTSAAPPAPQFFVVGGLWVPPPEYAAAAAAAAQQHPGQLAAADASGSAGTVYAPVATLPSGPQPQQLVQRQPSRSSDGRGSGSADDASSASPAASSSSQTTSA